MGKKTFKQLTTLKAGGTIDYFREVRNVEEIDEAVDHANSKGVPIFVLGEGSDILVSDKPFKGMVIKYVGEGIEVQEEKNDVFVRAGAGVYWDDLVKFVVEGGYQGVECMSGIPGTVGAAPVQNIGAYGQELKDSFYSLTAYEIKKKKTVVFYKEDCEFGYRESIFKRSKNWQKYIITDVTLKLAKNSKPFIKYDSLKTFLNEKGKTNPTLMEVRLAVLEIRGGKFENYRQTPNAGSFFKNPVLKENEYKKLTEKYGQVPCYQNSDGTFKCFAGWFIEKAGWKGKKYKNAGVSQKHALVLVNPGGKAKSEEIYALSEQIINDVEKKFDVRLEKEVQFINF